MRLIKKYCKKNNFYPNITIVFNRMNFTINTWSTDIEVSNENEYLPGVYINLQEKYSQCKLDENIDKLMEVNGLFKKLFLLIKAIILKFLIEKRQEITLSLEVKNNRDDIIILENKELIFENKKPNQDPINEKFFGVTIDKSEEYTKFENIEPYKIMYPYASGGWGDRCIMKQIFGDLALFHTQGDKYRFFEENEMHYAVSQVEYLKNICSSRGQCKGILEKFREGSYISEHEDKWSDGIRLNERNGVYEILNGNHRACCARMFKIIHIRAEVCKTFNSRKESYSMLGYKPMTIRNPLNIYLTKDYYSILLKLGINKFQAIEILEKGLRGKDLINYIEKVTNRSLLGLYREFNKQ